MQKNSYLCAAKRKDLANERKRSCFILPSAAKSYAMASRQMHILLS
jgi:hypothetical protein